MICYKSHALMVNKSHVYRHIMKGAPLYGVLWWGKRKNNPEKKYERYNYAPNA